MFDCQCDKVISVSRPSTTQRAQQHEQAAIVAIQLLRVVRVHAPACGSCQPRNRLHANARHAMQKLSCNEEDLQSPLAGVDAVV